jgi:predicted acyl esterase
MGWLRASHRRLDPERSLPYRPWHTHDKLEYLAPNEKTALEIEILPTSIVIPAGYRLALTVQGHDWPESTSFQADKWDKRPELYAGTTTLHSGPEDEAYLLLPVI